MESMRIEKGSAVQFWPRNWHMFWGGMDLAFESLQSYWSYCQLLRGVKIRMRYTQKILLRKISARKKPVLVGWGNSRCSYLMRWAIPSLLSCMICALQGCDFSPSTPSAPDPTPNPHPQTTYHLKISVQAKSDVNKVEVKSTWAAGNIGCLPIHPVSGATIQKQVQVNEKVERSGQDYIATIVEDRFLPDKCNWSIGGWEIRFLHDDQILSLDASGVNMFKASKRLELTCIPPPDKPPLCGLRSSEAFDRSHFNGVFNVTMEMAK